MDQAKDLRWRQRFQNFERAFRQLSLAVVRVAELSDLEKEGLIQRFEYTFELAWKTLKDYLESQQVSAKFPREVVRQAFHYELIADGDIWMEMLEKRNLIAHAYNEENFRQAIEAISHDFFPAIAQVFAELQSR